MRKFIVLVAFALSTHLATAAPTCKITSKSEIEFDRIFGIGPIVGGHLANFRYTVSYGSSSLKETTNLDVAFNDLENLMKQGLCEPRSKLFRSKCKSKVGSDHIFVGYGKKFSAMCNTNEESLAVLKRLKELQLCN